MPRVHKCLRAIPNTAKAKIKTKQIKATQDERGECEGASLSQNPPFLEIKMIGNGPRDCFWRRHSTAGFCFILDDAS